MNGKRYGTRDQKENGNFLVAKMIRNFQQTNHPVFTSISALNRGILKHMKAKTSIHFIAEMTNSEILSKLNFLRISSESTEQLRIGAADSERKKMNKQKIPQVKKKF